jgi:prevent-host-death family protein
MADKHMGVAEVKRRFADVVGEVMHAKKRIIVERRGRPVAAIVPLEEVGEARPPGQRLAAAVGCGRQEGEDFRRLMAGVVAKRRRRLPRRSPGRGK